MKKWSKIKKCIKLMKLKFDKNRQLNNNNFRNKKINVILAL